jgi:coiled-coil domain-containing protein 130
MGERRATNKYYPPEWDPSKGSLNEFRGHHALGVRAKKLHEGVLVVRFEMPFNVWCLGCSQHIGKGVRYNAEKRRVGHYLSTPIWEFSMRCRLCGARMVIRTDPQHAGFALVSGLRQKVETYSAADAGVVELQSDAEKERLARDPFFRLERSELDKASAAAAAAQIEGIARIRQRMADDFGASRILRKRLRDEKHATQQRASDAKRRGLQIELLPEAPEDAQEARRVEFRAATVAARAEERARRVEAAVADTVAVSAPLRATASLRKAVARGVDPRRLRLLASEPPPPPQQQPQPRLASALVAHRDEDDEEESGRQAPGAGAGESARGAAAQ